MLTKSTWWIVGLFLIIALIALLGPGMSAWARPSQPIPKTVPTPTFTPVLIPSNFLPLIIRM